MAVKYVTHNELEAAGDGRGSAWRKWVSRHEDRLVTQSDHVEPAVFNEDAAKAQADERAKDKKAERKAKARPKAKAPAKK